MSKKNKGKKTYKKINNRQLTPGEIRLQNKKDELDRKIEARKKELDIKIADTRRNIRSLFAYLFFILCFLGGIEFIIDKNILLGIIVFLLSFVFLPPLWTRIREKWDYPKFLRPVLGIALFAAALICRGSQVDFSEYINKLQETTQQETTQQETTQQEITEEE